MMGTRSAGLQCIVVLASAMAIAILFLRIVYPAVGVGWPQVGAQLGAYALTLLVAITLRPRLARPRWVRPIILAISIILIVAATIFAATTRIASTWNTGIQHAATAASAGVVEEVVFRGVLWRRVRMLFHSSSSIVVIDTLAFVAYHVPSVVILGESAWTLVGVTVSGVAFSVFRLVTGGTFLPAAVHTAVDLSS